MDDFAALTLCCDFFMPTPASFCFRQLVDAGGVCGSVVSDPASGTRTVFYSHPDAVGRSNLTLYRSDDDAATWAAATNVYNGPAEYSSAALIRKTDATAHDQIMGQRKAPGEFSGIQVGQRVGGLFEKDGYQSIALAIIDQ